MTPRLGKITVEKIDMRHANRSEEDRIKAVTKLAAVSRGRQKSNNPTLRYNQLLKEAEGANPSRPLEFLPIVLYEDAIIGSGALTGEQEYRLLRFSHVKDGKVYTNTRAALAVLPYEKIPFYETTEDFLAFRIRAPMFIWAQLITHTQISTESQSDRVATENEYWLPDDIEDRFADIGNSLSDSDVIITWMINSESQKHVQDKFKKLGYNREIYSRDPYYFKMKEFIMTGWLNDDLAWPHFFRERDARKNWTQKDTSDLVDRMRELAGWSK